MTRFVKPKSLEDILEEYIYVRVLLDRPVVINAITAVFSLLLLLLLLLLVSRGMLSSSALNVTRDYRLTAIIV